MGRYKIAVVPAGQWGTALAVPLGSKGYDVRLWFRTKQAAEQFQQTGQNEHRLPGITLPGNVRATADLAEAVDDADVVIVASSSKGLPSLCERLRPVLPAKTAVLSVIKALFSKSPRFVSEVLAKQLADDSRVAVLSGPNFALEIARQLPAGTVVAATNGDVADFVQQVMMTDRFRVWTSRDIIGVQLGGALKNIIAIGAGLSDGLGMGHNARAALITRGIAEITRLGVVMGANPLTFAGVSGIGDMMLTCTGDLSRNRGAGLAIAKGVSPGTYIEDTDKTVEGIATTKAVYELAQQLKVDMPITTEIYRILYEGLPPEIGVQRLMTRQRRSEL